ncbi:MAG: D-alanine--D-alanine ligase family protein [Trueperaceae bacterium]|nr:D-alanine--D-alanine ligase family protein [Trueperaceae bacterium]
MSAGGRVLLLCGGRSGEHEVSLASAASVLAAAEDRLDLLPRVIARDGRLLSEAASRHALQAGRSDAPDPDAAPDPVRGLASLADGEVDVVFPLLHGPNGEDGTIQGLLSVLDVPFVGSGVLGSAAGMDKPTMKRIFASAGVPQVAWAEVHRADWRDDPDAASPALAHLPWPRFVKPAALGSSVGIGRADDTAGQADALHEAFRWDDRAIVEAGVTDGRELEVAVLGNEAPQASPPGEIRVPKGAFYDYAHKYQDGATELRVPAPLDPATANAVQAWAVQAFRLVGAAGLARVDFFLRPDGEVLVNEINTMPGFTRHSMYPKLFQAAGLSYPDLIVQLIALARARHAAASARTVDA